MLLVLDATTGQNGMAQAKVFAEAIGLTGVVLSKLDGSAKGGIVISVQKELGVPVKARRPSAKDRTIVAPFDPEDSSTAFSREVVRKPSDMNPASRQSTTWTAGFCIPEPLPAPESGRKPDPRHPLYMSVTCRNVLKTQRALHIVVLIPPIRGCQMKW